MGIYLFDVLAYSIVLAALPFLQDGWNGPLCLEDIPE